MTCRKGGRTVASDQQEPQPRVVRWIERPRNIILALGAIVGALAGIWNLVVWTHGKYESWQEHRPSTEYRRLNELRPNVQFDTFSEILDAKPQIRKQVGNRIAYTFVRSREYVYVVTDAGNTVLLFAITSRTDDFNPTFTSPWGEITLGKTSIADAMPSPDDAFPAISIHGFAGMSRYAYFETIRGAHVDNYLSYIVGVDDAGSMSDSTRLSMGPFGNTFAKLKLESRWASKNGAFFKQPEIEQFRKQTPVNTFAVTAPLVDPTSFIEVGPNQTDVVSLD
jgi:hypothetical protein